MRILVLGASGMLGSSVFRLFEIRNKYEVYGTLRSSSQIRFFDKESHGRLISGVDVLDHDSLISVFNKNRPNVVINCIGLIKQLADANDPLLALPINAMLPHRLLKLCSLVGARLVHISTDCVFSGRKGLYTERDASDADDLYGKSKYLGEIDGVKSAVTLRTSIIGPELNSSTALLEWFLSQQDVVYGYTKAIFSGLPTVELARVIHDIVIPRQDIFGLYHVSSKPISKFDLLELIDTQYEKKINLLKNEEVVIDRSLDASRFKAATGYESPEWQELVRLMFDFDLKKHRTGA